MKTKSSSPDKQNLSNSSKDQRPDPNLLQTLAEELETDENIDKLAKKLSKKAGKSTGDNKAPDLPFSKFLDKLGQAGTQ